MSGKSPYDPRSHMIKLPGRKDSRGERGPAIDYLPVKERVHWLREEHPEADISTSVVELTDTRCVMLARVSIPGGGAATAIGSETKVGFPDYIEKADTVALGRALAILGYGIDFSDEFELDRGEADPRDYKSMPPKAEAGKPIAEAEGWPENAKPAPGGGPGKAPTAPASKAPAAPMKVTGSMPSEPAEMESWFARAVAATPDPGMAEDGITKAAASLAIAFKTNGLGDKERHLAIAFLAGAESFKDLTGAQLQVLQFNCNRKAAESLARYVAWHMGEQKEASGG